MMSSNTFLMSNLYILTFFFFFNFICFSLFFELPFSAVRTSRLLIVIETDKIGLYVSYPLVFTLKIIFQPILYILGLALVLEFILQGDIIFGITHQILNLCVNNWLNRLFNSFGSGIGKRLPLRIQLLHLLLSIFHFRVDCISSHISAWQDVVNDDMSAVSQRVMLCWVLACSCIVDGVFMLVISCSCLFILNYS